MKSTAIAVAAVLAAAALAGCETTRYEANSQAVDDATITANVKSALVQDPTTRARNISVNTLNGTVELSGFVDSHAESREAERDASNVPGVRSVQNQLQITGEPGRAVVGSATSDQAISENVRSALASNPDTSTPRIKVSTSEGVVQLAGFVDTSEQRSEAGSIARSVQGVRSVDNDLRLNPRD